MTFHAPIANIGAFVAAYAHSDFLGKLVILSLVSLSVICWVLLVQKIWTTRQVVHISDAFKKAYFLNKEKLLHLDLDQLPRPKNARVPHPFGEIFKEMKAKTVEILNKNLYFSSQKEAQVYLSSEDLNSIESHGLSTISSETKRLEKNLFVLATIVTLAPFLGLLGTVWGILIAFSELGAGASAASNTAVLGGLSTALATTVLGLIIAIPALVSYNYLKNEIKQYSSEMEEFLYQLLFTVELHYRKADVS